ncbi:MAG: hypothetical protein BMS9Abin12_1666 [Acidimicrobiia bacterium]|nr:MAG: hypothetical protein BMS9Abin12_1666 [Acidimicrobiia bacterium]
MRWWAVIAVMGLILVGCAPASESLASTTTLPSTTTTTTTREPSSEICLSGDLPFSGDGLVAALGGEEGDASTISQIRWDTSANCERLTVAFGIASGAPATTLGPSAVSVIRYAGIVRVRFPTEVVQSAIAETLFEGSLVSSVFVVRDKDGLIFLDVHGTDEVPIEARAFTTTSPATLVIDITRADTAATPVGVTTTGTAVVVTPTPRTASYPIVVDGYVEPGLPAVRVQLIQSENVLVDRSVSVNGYTDTWQSFTSTIDEGPSGTAVLFVGTLDGNEKPHDGAFVSMTME